MAYSDALRQQYATFTSAADLIDGVFSGLTFFSAFSLASATAVLYVSQYAANANASALNLQKSRNATVGNHTIVNNADEVGRINFAPSNGSSFQTAAAIVAFVDGTPTGPADLPVGLVFQTTPDGSGTIAERMRITATGESLFGTTNSDPIGANVEGVVVNGPTKNIGISRSGNVPLYINRMTNDGNLVEFYQAGTLEGAISVAGNTITYGAFTAYHWSQLSNDTKPDFAIGTVFETINEMCEWPNEINDRLPKCKVSDAVGSKAVYGVFMGWDGDWTQTDDLKIVSQGAYFCRVAAGTVVAQGDLLESAGNGFGQIQSDDIVRSKTIGKVTATTPCFVELDGSFCIPTVLYCG